MGNVDSTSSGNSYPGGGRPASTSTAAGAAANGSTVSRSSGTRSNSNSSRQRRSGSDRPGAYTVPGPGRQAGSDSLHYTVNVPAGVRPGQDFQVVAGGVQMMVRCPDNVRPGERIMVLVPREHREQQQQQQTGQVYMATVPQGVSEGGSFQVMVNGKAVTVPCPRGVQPGQQIRIRLPESSNGGQQGNLLHQTFEVVVPPGVRPGQPFALIANQQRVMVHCPQDAQPGKKIRFQLPIQLSEAQLRAYNIHYDKDGWVRCVGADLKFHWVRHESGKKSGKKKYLRINGGADSNGEAEDGKEDGSNQPEKPIGPGSNFNPDTSAFVRKLTSYGPRQWVLEMVPADEVALEASVPAASLTFQHLSKVSTQAFSDKVKWFQQQCDGLRVPWDVAHQHLKVTRTNLLEDSMRAIETISTADMRQRFRFEFIGEPGVDAGGIAREWFQLVTEELFNPAVALFQYSAINQMCMQVNPASGIANDEHLAYFHFCGRVLGKALFDGQIIPAHLVRPMYKHIMGWPVMFSDLEHLDSATHDSLLKLMDMENVEVCYLDFTVTEDRMGQNYVVQLKKGGEDITVTNENLGEYMELSLKYRVMGRIREQLTAFLVGFYDVVPEALLSVFDFQELELLMCGLPTIEVEDWMAHTDYVGFFERQGIKHKVIKWFWEVLEDFDVEQKARLLQFVTGTSGVPSQGFAYLQGNDGSVRRFTINGVNLSGGMFPLAHTCFNRIDLPVYASKADLKQYLSLAIQLECTGFDID